MAHHTGHNYKQPSGINARVDLHVVIIYLTAMTSLIWPEVLQKCQQNCDEVAANTPSLSITSE